MKPPSTLRHFLCIACSALLAISYSHAATITWDANGSGALQTDGSGEWTTAGQWWNGSSNVNWTSGDDAIFGNGGTGGAVTLAGSTTVNSLTFNTFSGTYTLGDALQTITLTNGLTMNATAGNVTLISPITLGGAQSWLNNSSNLFSVGIGAVDNAGFLLTIGGSGNTTVSSAIGGAGGLTKTGAGIVTLSGTSTYDGKTLLNAGTLSIAGDANLGTAPVGVVADAINFTGSSTLQFTGTENPTIHSNRGITLDAGVTGTAQVVTAANTVAYGGIVTGASGTTFKKTGAGTLNLSGNSTSAFLGALNVDGGTLNLSGNGEMAGTSDVTIGNRGTLTLDNTATNLGNRTAGAITSSGGTINFIGNAAATTETLGALTLNAGALTIKSTAGAAGSTLTLPSITRSVVGGTLYLNNNTGANVVLSTAPTLVNSILKYAVVTDGAGLTSFANYTTSAGTDQTVVPLALASHNQIGGNVAVTDWTSTQNVRPSTDALLVSATPQTNAYTLTLDNGIDLLSSNTADKRLDLQAVLQTGGSSVVGYATTGSTDVILNFNANEALFHIVGTLTLYHGDNTTGTLRGTAGLTKSGGGTLILSGRSVLTTATGSVNLNEGIVDLRRADSLLPAASTVVQNLNGATLRLTSDTNTAYNGNLAVNADSIIQVRRVTIAATPTTHTLGALTLAAGRVLTVNSDRITSGTAYGLTTGVLTLSGAATINVANNGAGTGTMTVAAPSGNFLLTKTGAGDLVTDSITTGFSGNVNISDGRIGWSGASGNITQSQTFSGAGGIIKSGAGTVILSGTNTYTGATMVSAGTLLVNGSLTSDVTVSDGATLGGTGAVDDLTFEGGSFFDISNMFTATTINFAAGGFGIDNLRQGGALVNWASIPDSTYTLITGNLNETNLENFGFANKLSIGGDRFAYFQEGSLQLVVTTIPEPGAAFIGSLGLLALLRRRRH